MNALLWALQIIAALLYGPSGIVKMFLSEKMSRDVSSVGHLSPNGWRVVGFFELVCAVGLVLPAAFHWRPDLTIFAAALLTVESVAFVGSRIKHREAAALVVSAVPGIAMAFVTYGRMVLLPIG